VRIRIDGQVTSRRSDSRSWAERGLGSASVSSGGSPLECEILGRVVVFFAMSFRLEAA
jgi:hypothetical protein